MPIWLESLAQVQLLPTILTLAVLAVSLRSAALRAQITGLKAGSPQEARLRRCRQAALLRFAFVYLLLSGAALITRTQLGHGQVANACGSDCATYLLFNSHFGAFVAMVLQPLLWEPGSAIQASDAIRAVLLGERPFALVLNLSWTIAVVYALAHFILSAQGKVLAGDRLRPWWLVGFVLVSPVTLFLVTGLMHLSQTGRLPMDDQHVRLAVVCAVWVLVMRCAVWLYVRRIGRRMDRRSWRLRTGPGAKQQVAGYEYL